MGGVCALAQCGAGHEPTEWKALSGPLVELDLMSALRPLKDSSAIAD
jgi:hypothetical protein